QLCLDLLARTAAGVAADLSPFMRRAVCLGRRSRRSSAEAGGAQWHISDFAVPPTAKSGAFRASFARRASFSRALPRRVGAGGGVRLRQDSRDVPGVAASGGVVVFVRVRVECGEDREQLPQRRTLIGEGMTTVLIAENMHFSPKTVKTFRTRIK